MTIKDKTCCFTGHRNISQAQIPVLTKKVTATIRMLVAQGVIYYGAGGALGFDTISAMAVLKLQHTIPQIKLILVLPCLSQAQRWSKNDQEIYESIRWNMYLLFNKAPRRYGLHCELCPKKRPQNY